MPNKNTISQEIISNLRHFHPKKIVLFGSMTKGKFVEGKSDIDLLVITDTGKNSVDRYTRVRLALTSSCPFDIFVLTKKELREKLRTNFFFREIMQEGNTIYEEA